MPELPEVETTRAGIAPHLTGRTVTHVIVRNPALRWPIPDALGRELPGRRIESVSRRAKYLLIKAGDAHLMLHLGMSGRLHVLDQNSAAGKHDHIDILLDDDQLLRLHDPRRFGAALWFGGDPAEHELIRHLGPEPLSDDFSAEHLFRQSRKRKAAVKNFLMDGRLVVGVGNIYASESLFLAGIRPGRAAGRVSMPEYTRLQQAVVKVLNEAIAAGGTTLRDFKSADGQPGYFQQNLNVYGREHQPCKVCAMSIRRKVIGQRSSYYCPQCQQ